MNQSFTNTNNDFNNLLNYIILLISIQLSNLILQISSNITYYYSNIKIKQMTKSVLILEIYNIIIEIDIKLYK